MKRHHAGSLYETEYTSDDKDGFAGLVLFCTNQNGRERVASVIYWDADGQYAVETFGTDVPLKVIEEIIAEAKAIVKVS